MDSLLPEHHAFWRVDAMPLHFLLENRHSYPSRDEVRRVHANVLLQFSRGHFIDDTSRLFSLQPLYALLVIRQNFAQLKEINGRHCNYLIYENETQCSRGTAQVEAIARKK